MSDAKLLREDLVKVLRQQAQLVRNDRAIKSITVLALEQAADALAALSPSPADGWVAVPREPTIGRLVSMAIRADHALGCPGYYDQSFIRQANGVSHQQMLESTIRTMRQLYEEATGQGFYREAKEEEYKAMLAAAPADEQ